MLLAKIRCTRKISVLQYLLYVLLEEQDMLWKVPVTAIFSFVLGKSAIIWSNKKNRPVKNKPMIVPVSAVVVWDALS